MGLLTDDGTLVLLAADHKDEDDSEQNDDEALTKAPGNGANQLPPQNA